MEVSDSDKIFEFDEDILSLDWSSPSPSENGSIHLACENRAEEETVSKDGSSSSESESMANDDRAPSSLLTIPLSGPSGQSFPESFDIIPSKPESPVDLDDYDIPELDSDLEIELERHSCQHSNVPSPSISPEPLEKATAEDITNVKPDIMSPDDWIWTEMEDQHDPRTPGDELQMVTKADLVTAQEEEAAHQIKDIVTKDASSSSPPDEQLPQVAALMEELSDRLEKSSLIPLHYWTTYTQSLKDSRAVAVILNVVSFVFMWVTVGVKDFCTATSERWNAFMDGSDKDIVYSAFWIILLSGVLVDEMIASGFVSKSPPEGVHVIPTISQSHITTPILSSLMKETPLPVHGRDLNHLMVSPATSEPIRTEKKVRSHVQPENEKPEMTPESLRKFRRQRLNTHNSQSKTESSHRKKLQNSTISQELVQFIQDRFPPMRAWSEWVAYTSNATTWDMISEKAKVVSKQVKDLAISSTQLFCSSNDTVSDTKQDKPTSQNRVSVVVSKALDVLSKKVVALSTRVRSDGVISWTSAKALQEMWAASRESYEFGQMVLSKTQSSKLFPQTRKDEKKHSGCACNTKKISDDDACMQLKTNLKQRIKEVAKLYRDYFESLELSVVTLTN